MNTLGMDGSVADTIRHMVLPVTVLAVSLAGSNIRYIRSSFLEILQQDYLRTARAKGIGYKRVIWKHAMRNALLPIVTVIGMQIPMLFGGAVIIEQVFSWPGLGYLAVQSIIYRDFQLVQGIVLWIALMYMVINLVVDISYNRLDPRLRKEGR